MNTEDSKVDALYAIARNVQEAGERIESQLKSIKAYLEDISAGIASINAAMPNPLDRPEQ